MASGIHQERARARRGCLRKAKGYVNLKFILACRLSRCLRFSFFAKSIPTALSLRLNTKFCGYRR